MRDLTLRAPSPDAAGFRLGPPANPYIGNPHLSAETYICDCMHSGGVAGLLDAPHAVTHTGLAAAVHNSCGSLCIVRCWDLQRPRVPKRSAVGPHTWEAAPRAGSAEVRRLRRAPPLAPVSTALTLAAKRSEHSDSPTDAGSGLMLTNISVLPSPPRHGCGGDTWLFMQCKRSDPIEPLQNPCKTSDT